MRRLGTEAILKKTMGKVLLIHLVTKVIEGVAFALRIIAELIQAPAMARYFLPAKAMGSRVVLCMVITCNLVLAKSGWAAEDNRCANQPQTSQEFCREALDLLLRGDSERPDLTVVVTGRQYAWRYDYRLPPVPSGSGPELKCTVSGPLILPQGKSVQLLVTSEDLIHEWTIPSLSIQAEAIPGRLETVNFDTSKPGTFLGGATSASGAVYREIGIEVHVLAQNAYTAWERETLRKTCQASK